MRTLLLALTAAALCAPAACATDAASAPSSPADPVTTKDTVAVNATAPAATSAEDPYLWLEDVTGDKQLDWVRANNAVAQKELEAAPGFEATRQRLLSIMDSKEKIPFVTARAGHLYNFWQDEQNPRGLWRRTTMAEFKGKTPAWEVILDVDALGKAEGESWVWAGATCLFPTYERCLVKLSRGGADATVVREFDTVKKAFVDGGFVLPEAKSDVAWKDADTITVGTDFGEGSLTDSGYPRITKEWQRGTPLSSAKTIYEAKKEDIAASSWREFDHGHVRDWVSRSPSFFTNELYLREGDTLTKIDKPDDASADVWDDQLLVALRSDWTIGTTTWPAGALLVMPFADFRAGQRDFTMLYTPTANTGLESWTGTKSAMLVVELEDVKSRVYLHTPTRKNGKVTWVKTAVDAPAVGSFSVRAFDEDDSDDYWFTDSGFLSPTTLSIATIGKKGRTALKSEPAHFKADGLEVSQHFAVSKDGTRVPYFQISKAGLALNGQSPTILDGYGGFEISLTPGYSGGRGAAWLERGGVYVVANIRGGGEYGPRWHKAALKHNRQRAYDDFIAIAEDLISRKVTSTPHLGIVGGSNGGLLMGVMMTQRPDLFGAIVCQVPLLDMKRYHKLLAGASWMEEYGDPDNAEDWAALSKFSPYQNIKAGVTYPRTLFVTSTRDDRVHPGHARKMVARLLENKVDLLSFENIEGGHGGAADNKQRAYMWALTFTFFSKQLGLAP